MIDLIALCLHGLLSAAMTSAKSATLRVEGCEFGDVYASTPAICDISFSNMGETPISVNNFQVVSGTGAITPGRLTVAPHSTAQAHVQIDTSKSIGRNSYIVVFDTDPKSDLRSAKVKGYVLSALDQGSPQIDLGVVNLSDVQAKHEYQLSSHEVANFRIERVLDAPSWLAAGVRPDGRTLDLSVKADAPWGLQEDYVRVGLNTIHQKEAFIKIKADVHGDILPSTNPLNFGIVRLGDSNEVLVRLNSLSHKKFRVGDMKLEGFSGASEILPCIPAAIDCKMIRLAVSKTQPAGSLRGTLWVELPDYKKKLPITTWGFLVAKDYQIQKVKDLAAQSEVATKTPDLKTVLKNATAPKPVEAPSPPGSGPLLKWTVAEAASVYGFQIFRSESEEGPFVLMNATPIHADTENNDSQSFQWRDNNVRSGSAYYYSIGILRINGKKEHLAGPQKIVAK